MDVLHALDASNPAPLQLSEPRKAPHPYKTIVVALDGSELAEQVFPHVAPLAHGFGATLICVTAVPPADIRFMAPAALAGPYDGGEALVQMLDSRDQIRASDKRYLANVATRLTAEGIAVTCEEPEQRAADAIVNAAVRHGANLIAMTTHGRSGIRRAVLGSVADEVIHRAPCPVLLVRASQDSIQPTQDWK